mmetsp:Transcript_17425/g.41339  ORF Transcript_17425/g.41339 Transcript_17425/m.41339 type:complete len:247 (+) Transcript_17425:36-776(+)|eukprot:CAMPEP_0181452854 /NCGR_PEP_ID=MMETSP1110-20121109/29424_1 /TAXON_ID=174948 /ORGANISM="Symbiodinium sp., Strain CCMP421" /LENGTH=246 /DNA_ID=CAMNT_0023577155 /DNA_START=27 /DNA_END=767 /DNA_ORIENTATION=-
MLAMSDDKLAHCDGEDDRESETSTCTRRSSKESLTSLGSWQDGTDVYDYALDESPIGAGSLAVFALGISDAHVNDTIAVLKDESGPSVQVSGSCDEALAKNSVARFLHRGGPDFAVYLSDDGTAELFALETRVVNRRDDEEHTQTTFWGTWREGPSGEVGLELHTMEKKVFNEFIDHGLMMQTGKVSIDLSMLFRWTGRLLQTLSRGPADGSPWCVCHFPEWLTCAAGSELHVFDEWHVAGTSTEP